MTQIRINVLKKQQCDKGMVPDMNIIKNSDEL